VSLVVYVNLLFSVVTVQVGGQDKIAKARQEIECLLLGFFKGSRVCAERQVGIAMPGKFLHDLSRCPAVHKEKNIAVSQTVKTHRITLYVCRFNSRYSQHVHSQLANQEKILK